MNGLFGKLALLCLLIGVFFTMSSCGDGSGSAPSDSNAFRLLPDAPPEWRESGDAKLFVGLALSDYINGGSEAYYAYGCSEVATRSFENDSGARLTVEVYEMDRPVNAFGVYSTDSAGEHWDVGADASYGSGLLRFWKGRFFVRLLCYPADKEIEKVIRETGLNVAASIEGDSARPELFLSLLPEDGLTPDSACYFHRQTSLNNIRFISDENLLNLGDDIDAITWEEGAPGEALLRQIALRYPTNSAAEAAYTSFSMTYLNVKPEGESKTVLSPGAVRQSNDRYAAARVAAPWLVVALDAPSAESAAAGVMRTLAAIDMTK